jgi:hypothetical protein
MLTPAVELLIMSAGYGCRQEIKGALLNLFGYILLFTGGG